MTGRELLGGSVDPLRARRACDDRGDSLGTSFRGGGDERAVASRRCGAGCGVGDVIRDVLGIVLDPPDERGAAGVLPGQAEEVEAGHIGDTRRCRARSLGPRTGGLIHL